MVRILEDVAAHVPGGTLAEVRATSAIAFHEGEH
jgi:hypothetical protein